MSELVTLERPDLEFNAVQFVPKDARQGHRRVRIAIHMQPTNARRWYPREHAHRQRFAIGGGAVAFPPSWNASRWLSAGKRTVCTPSIMTLLGVPWA